MIQRIFKSLYLVVGLTHLMFVVDQRLAHAQERLGAYNYYAQGSGRSMAMGGAYTAISRDVSGMNFNPSGLALADWKYDLNGTLNRTVNKALNSADLEGQEDRGPVNFIQGGAALRLGTWVAALGVSVPYNDELIAPGSSQKHRASLVTQSGELVIAKSWSRSFSLGIGYHYEKVGFSYFEPGTPAIDIEHSAEGGYPRIGLLYDDGKSAIGLSYTPRRHYEVDASADDTHSVQLLYDLVMPSRTTLGLLARPRKDWLVSIDLERIESLEDENLISFGPDIDSIRGARPMRSMDLEEKTILRVGTEWAVIQSGSTDVILRGGFYNEPARLIGGVDRNHFTYGLQVRFGPAILAVSIDQAEDFTNTSQGFSVVWGSI